MRSRPPFRAAVNGIAPVLLTALVAMPLTALAGAAASHASPVAGAAATHVSPVAASKPSAPITISSRLQSEPMIGQPVDLVISVSVGQDMSAASMVIAADDPLAVIEPIGTVALGDVAVGASADVGVTVLPLVDQTHYLRVTVTGTIDGHVQSTSLSVPIRLEGQALRQADDEGAGKTEETVRSFQAVEAVR